MPQDRSLPPPPFTRQPSDLKGSQLLHPCTQSQTHVHTHRVTTHSVHISLGHCSADRLLPAVSIHPTHSFYRGESRPGQDHPDQSLSAADQEHQRGIQPRPPTSRPGLQAPAALITDGRSWPKGPPCPCPAGRDKTRPRNRKVLREPFPSPQRPGLTQSLPPAQAQSKKNQFQEAAPGLQAAFRPDCNSARGGPGPLCPAWGPWAKPEGLASVCRLNCQPPDPSGFPPTLLSPLSLFSPLGGIIL